MTSRLSTKTALPKNVTGPNYNTDEIGVGIVHIGFGAFHRAHQALYTDDAIAAHGGDWRITGVSLRSGDIANKINLQDGLYGVLIRDDSDSSFRVIGSVKNVIAIHDVTHDTTDAEQYKLLFDVLTRTTTRIVTSTVTEKAYGFDRIGGGVMDTHPAIEHDLKSPHKPTGVIGILVEALRRRRELDVPPFTVLCCDNLPANGTLLKKGVVDFAKYIDTELANYIEQQVSFPSTMVDRITPAVNDATLLEVEEKLNTKDFAAVETEAFSQWVIEDDFPTGRPSWEAGGALLVSDVEPFETMKLRMLNGTHSLIAYTGYLSGHRFVRDAMRSDDILRWVKFHLEANARTLTPLSGMDYSEYAETLLLRFANRSIAHETYQIAMDGTEKLPQRIFSPTIHALQHNQCIASFALATAAWLRYCTGVDEQGRPFKLQDPREAEIAKVVQSAPLNAQLIYDAVISLPNLFPKQLVADDYWKKNVLYYFHIMLTKGINQALSCVPGECQHCAQTNNDQ